MSALSAVISFSSVAQAQYSASLTRYVQNSGTHETLLAVSAFSEKVAWASGTRGTVVRTTDGGKTWKPSKLPTGDSLDFQNIYAINGSQAFVMSVGQGRKTRIFNTTDGGAHWKPKYMSLNAELVWRCFGFWNADHAIGISDVQKGDFLMMFSLDGGASWDRVPADSFPAALPGEHTSASNPACIRTGWYRHAWFTTSMGRVIRTTNYGGSWKASFVHIAIGDAQIINSIMFRDESHGLVFGEVKAAPGKTVISETNDGGKSWDERTALALPISVASTAYVPFLSGPTIIAVGSAGAIFSRDNGLTWNTVDTLSYTSVTFAARNAGWAVGADGRITKITF